jgi:hypothetical protein
MKTLFIMLALMTLLGCAVKDASTAVAIETETEGLDAKITSPRTADKTSKQVTKASADDVQPSVESIGPLWTIRSEPSIAQIKDAPEKFRKKTGKPQGPFSVRYVLESWSLDDHRLVIEVQSNQSISNWHVNLPQVIEKQEIVMRLRKPETAQQAVPAVRTFLFGALPASDRLILTVNAEVSGVIASKTVSVPIRFGSIPARSGRSCGEAQSDFECLFVLPGTISK